MPDVALYDYEEATDFRPFFDMVIGILFVLLILVAAQIYFQQVQSQGGAAKRNAALRQAEIASFLGVLAERLRSEGIQAVADTEGSAVLLPLRDIMTVDGAGLPQVEGVRAGPLGATLLGLTACVTEPRSPDLSCSGFGRLHLDVLGIDVRVGALPVATALPRDRFEAVAGALLSASLLRGAPGLIGASNEAGGRVLEFSHGLAGAAAAGGAQDGAIGGLGGDVVLDFTFR